jgi:DNA-binding PadR family transcriptional regulator
MGLTLTEAKINLLQAIGEGTTHGYALSKKLGVRCSTIYEHLEQLEEEGYLESEMEGRRRVYSLTRKGELIVEAHQEENT